MKVTDIYYAGHGIDVHISAEMRNKVRKTARVLTVACAVIGASASIWMTVTALSQCSFLLPTAISTAVAAFAGFSIRRRRR